MRHIKIFFFFTFIILGFTQCKKEETTPSTPTIIGKWELVSSTWKNYKNNLLIGSGTEDLKLVGYTCQFNNDQTVIVTDKYGTYNYKYTLSNMNLVIDGGKYTIVELTSNKLVFSYDNDVTTTSKEVVTDTFNKIK